MFCKAFRVIGVVLKSKEAVLKNEFGIFKGVSLKQNRDRLTKKIKMWIFGKIGIVSFLGGYFLL